MPDQVLKLKMVPWASSYGPTKAKLEFRPQCKIFRCGTGILGTEGLKSLIPAINLDTLRAGEKETLNINVVGNILDAAIIFQKTKL